MIDLSTLTPQEIKDLEKQLQKYKKSEKNLVGYKATFYVRFNPEFHKNDMLTSLGDVSPEDFGEWVVNAIPDTIINTFEMQSPEDVSGFVVEVASKKELDAIWGFPND